MLMDPLLLIGCILLALFWALWVHGKPRIKSLKNKHVVITGGSQGIGLQMASLALLDHAFVTIISRTPHKLQKAVEDLVKETKCPSEHITFQVADIGNYEQIREAIEACHSWKPIDVLVCNAGYFNCEYFEKMPVEDLDYIVRTNLTGTLYTIRAATPFLKNKSSSPKSIFIVSSASSQFFFYGNPVYTATKYALNGLAEALRFELIPHNISVGISCPYFVDTESLQRTLAEMPVRRLKALKLFNFYHPGFVEDPRKVAKYSLKALKNGSFMASSLFPAFYTGTFTRGVYPADSLIRAIMELVVYLPFRVLTFLSAIFTPPVIMMFGGGKTFSPNQSWVFCP